MTERSRSCGPSRRRVGPPPSSPRALGQGLEVQTFVHFCHMLALGRFFLQGPGELPDPWASSPPLLHQPLPPLPGTAPEEGAGGLRRVCPEPLTTRSGGEAAGGCGREEWGVSPSWGPLLPGGPGSTGHSGDGCAAS